MSVNTPFSFKDIPTKSWFVAHLPKGLKSYIAIFHPKNKTSNDLIIVHHGHSNEYLKEVTETFLNNGQTVAHMWMPNYGPNSVKQIANVEIKYHRSYWNLEEKVKFNPIEYFLDPINQLINSMEGFERIIMVGLSGGAYTTHLYQAIDPRVSIGFATAGGTPIFARQPPYNAFYPSSFKNNPIGDYEMAHPSIIGHSPKVSHLDLYVMAASDNREHHVIRLPFEPSNSGLAANFYARPAIGIAEAIGGNLKFIHDWSSCKHDITRAQLDYISRSLQSSASSK